jgi:hypothetical protein
LIDWLKNPEKDKARRGDVLRVWSLLLFLFEFIAAVVLSLKGRPELVSLQFVLLYYAWSRVNEIAIAFYRESKPEPKETDIGAADRIVMTLRSYFGLVFCFAIAYYLLPHLSVGPWFTFPAQFEMGHDIHSFVDALYFSGVTIATIGYGDIAPCHWIARLLVLWEVFLGIYLVAIAIAGYVGALAAELAERAKEQQGAQNDAAQKTSRSLRTRVVVFCEVFTARLQQLVRVA